MAGRIILITDGPAAMVHTVELLRLLRQDHFTVRVAPTGYPGASALSFTTELTWALLSGHPCLEVDKLDKNILSEANAIVLAPISETVLQVFSHGKALELLQSAGRPVIICPVRTAATPELLTHDLLSKLPEHSAILMPSPAEPPVSLGAAGTIMMASPAVVCEAIHHSLSKHLLEGKRLLLTCGPTVEDFDPVRFISNRSSGKMGMALAIAARRQGASVTVVHGPIHIAHPAISGIEYIPVRSASQMHDAVMARHTACDIAILCAAVADFTPTAYTMQKIKKTDGEGLQMELKRTQDILAEMGTLPPEEKPYLVGFAAETNDVATNATGKLYRKHCNMLCSNDVTASGCGFAVDTNQVVIYTDDGASETLPLLSKQDTAARIISKIASRLS